MATNNTHLERTTSADSVGTSAAAGAPFALAFSRGHASAGLSAFASASSVLEAHHLGRLEVEDRWPTEETLSISLV